ncbi:MAG: hypothetical protein R3F61_34125 [Myxococcota bacterium]
MLALVLALACNTPAPEAPSHTSVLQKADARDGSEDHVVGQCAGCSLAMSGDPAHAVQHEGYTLHFCSETCKSGFEADVDAGMKRIEAAVTH